MNGDKNNIMEMSVEELTELTLKLTEPTRPAKKGYKWTKNMMSGVWVEIPETTPFCCDPANETYWSM